MKIIKKYWEYVLLFLLFAFLSYTFVLTKEDLTWAVFGTVGNLKDFFNLSNGNYVASLLLMLFTKSRIIKALSYGILTVSLLVSMRNAVNKKNNTLIFISAFLILLIGRNLFNSSYAYLTGFINNFISALFILITINMFIKEKIKLNKVLIFLWGIVVTSLNLYTSISLLLFSVILSIYKSSKKVESRNTFILSVGLLCGTIFNLVENIIGNRSILIDNPINYLFHKIIPDMYSYNFIIMIVLLAFLLFLCIKIFTKGSFNKKVLTIISMSGITFYASVFILSSNNILNYIALIVFYMASLFILLNANNSIIFKKHIKTYYLFKMIYFIIILFINNTNLCPVLPIIVIDIVIILELINYVFPNNFLKKTWTLILTLLLLSNIYIYSTVNKKFMEMNWYIKNNLECGKNEVFLPSKYETDYLYDYYPKTLSDKEYYLKYYQIEIDLPIYIRFKN